MRYAAVASIRIDVLPTAEAAASPYQLLLVATALHPSRYQPVVQALDSPSPPDRAFAEATVRRGGGAANSGSSTEAVLAFRANASPPPPVGALAAAPTLVDHVAYS